MTFFSNVGLKTRAKEGGDLNKIDSISAKKISVLTYSLIWCV